MTDGIRLLISLARAQDVQAFHDLRPELFTSKFESDVYEYCQTHLVDHGAIPVDETLAEVFDLSLGATPEPVSFYRQKVVDRWITHSLQNGVEALKQHYSQESGWDVHSLMSSIAHITTDIRSTHRRNPLYDYRSDHQMVIDDYVEKATEQEFSGLSLGWPTVDNMTNGLAGGDVTSIIGRPRMGKALEDTMPVCMSDGSWKAVGDIRVGEYVVGQSGPTKVLGVYPQGPREIVRLFFASGRVVECTRDHLWTGFVCKGGNDGRTATVSTQWLIDVLDRNKSVTRKSRVKFKVPAFTGDFGQEWDLRIDPWLAGFLSIGAVVSSQKSVVAYVPKKLKSLVESMVKDSNARWSCDGGPVVSMTPAHMNAKGQYYEFHGSGVREFTDRENPGALPKFVFRLNSADRARFLSGILDRWARFKPRAVYVDVSDFYGAMSRGLMALIYSVGGWCNSTERGRCGIKHPCLYLLFFLRSHKELAAEHPWCTSAEDQLVSYSIPGLVSNCTCIKVEAEDGLFATLGYLVTHNTYALVYSALHAWRTQGKRILFVSMEMSPLLIFQRLTAVLSNVSITEIRAGKVPSDQYELMVKQMKSTKGGPPFNLLYGNSKLTVEDIYLAAIQCDPDAIIIDGAYLLASRNYKLGKFERVGDNMDKIKFSLSVDLDVPTLLSFQFNREASKKLQKGKRPGLEDIAFADEIGQYSSLVLGLFESEQVDTQLQRRVDILKGRNGESGDFVISWDFSNMDFSEITLNPGDDYTLTS